jgi:NADPH-dependent curcumin reductase CurA
MGAKVYAIAGSQDKCSWLINELGVDGAFNYKQKGWEDDFKKQVGYLDVFFDNVGGDILDFFLTRLKKDARIVLCGAISAYSMSFSALLFSPCAFIDDGKPNRLGQT